MTYNNDTEPNMRRVEIANDNGVSAPPRLLLWGVIALFVLIIGGGIVAIAGFRFVLQPAQQQRVIDQVPFMRAFMAPTPQGGTLPTVVPDQASNDAALDLLNMPLSIASVTPFNTDVPMVATIAPTATPILATSEATPILNTPTTQAIIATPVVTPTQVSQTTSQSVVNAIPSSERIVGFRHEQQTWNNCGPATLTTALSYFGWTRDQEYAKNILRPNREDKNVGPDELVNFVNTQTQIKAIARMGGNLQILKTLIANRFPVIVERGIMFEAYDWVGHYQLLVAYDDGQGQFYAYDSFLGTGAAEQGVPVPYQQLDEDWRAFNRTFLVVYNPADEGLLKTLLGDLFDPLKAAEIAFNTAQAETRKNPQDAFAWFNMGSSLVALNDFQRAANAFDQARRYILPWRLTWYEYGPFIAYFNVGRFDDVLSLADVNLINAQELEETYYWRGKVYAAQGDIAKASSEFQRALGYNPNYQAARDALDALS
jgi:hypothetical protein